MAPCYSPVSGYRQRDGTISPSRRNAISFIEQERACGYCSGCRQMYVTDWAKRVECETQVSDGTMFLTLTYNSEHIPKYGFLDYSHPRLFMKRLRKRFGKGIRSFGVAEYGSKGRRPHYHICLFNFDLPVLSKATDAQVLAGEYKLFYTDTDCGPLYTSPVIEKLWSDVKTKKSRGFHTIGTVTYETGAYVASYMHKKVKGNKSAVDDRYTYLDLDTGELIDIPKERSVCVSLKPGIGKPWLEKFHTDCYPSDKFIRSGGIVSKPPKYFDKLFELWHPKEMAEIKLTRKEKQKENSFNSTPDRLRAREKFFLSKLRSKKRGFENGS